MHLAPGRCKKEAPQGFLKALSYGKLRNREIHGIPVVQEVDGLAGFGNEDRGAQDSADVVFNHNSPAAVGKLDVTAGRIYGSNSMPDRPMKYSITSPGR